MNRAAIETKPGTPVQVAFLSLISVMDKVYLDGFRRTVKAPLGFKLQDMTLSNRWSGAQSVLYLGKS